MRISMKKIAIFSLNCMLLNMIYVLISFMKYKKPLKLQQMNYLAANFKNCCEKKNSQFFTFLRFYAFYYIYLLP